MTNEEYVEAIRAGRMQPIELWLHISRFVRMKAVKYVDNGTELEDLIQESYFGFQKALELYNPQRDAKFLTYCDYWIRRSMTLYKERTGRIVRVSSVVRRRAAEYERFLSGFKDMFKRSPTEREVRAALGWDKEQVEREVAAALTVASLDKPVGDSEDASIVDLIPGESDVESDVLDKIQAEELREKLWSCVDTLPERQRTVICQRYKDNRTLQECGDALGITRERVRQIEAAALRKMRTGKIRKELEPFLDDIRYSLGVRKGKDPTARAVVKMENYLAKLEKEGLI